MTRLLITPVLAAVLLSPGAVYSQAPEYQPQAQSPEERIQAQQKRELTQPGNNAPVWRNVQSGVPNVTTVQGRETEVLIQPPARFPGQESISTAGEAWRLFRNGPVTFYGGAVVLATLIAILAFYFWKGPVKITPTWLRGVLPRVISFSTTVEGARMPTSRPVSLRLRAGKLPR